ncbi:hypothetical protein [Nostoc sp.]
MNWNLILSPETHSVEGLHPAHLSQDFYNKNQQGVLKVEDKTNTFAVTVSPTWRGLTLKLRQGVKNVTDCADSLYQDLLGRFAAQQGKAESEPFWNPYLTKWVVSVVFPSGCRSIPCEWLEMLLN